MMLDDSFETTCPDCGGDDLKWHLPRKADPLDGDTLFVEWRCPECGASWSESILLEMDREPDQAHDVDPD
jgi:C4-type Zn-finger protein